MCVKAIFLRCIVRFFTTFLGHNDSHSVVQKPTAALDVLVYFHVFERCEEQIEADDVDKQEQNVDESDRECQSGIIWDSRVRDDGVDGSHNVENDAAEWVDQEPNKRRRVSLRRWEMDIKCGIKF